MTPAVKQLDKSTVSYQLHHYQHDKNNSHYGEEAAEKLAVAANRIYKTLVVETDDHSLAVAIIPVSAQLNLKQTAKALNVKKAIMAAPQKVQSTTGYVLGGVSPFGQKKRLPTLIDNSMENLTTVFVSGGKRGLEIETTPQAFSQILNAKMVAIAEQR
ncbi:Cys-tRNA(Pro) deacylase [Thalassotalea sp. G2M2-11]|uniref:Cys-tRNA(Pro) deacylase n=1 Tax=Thalassotalea sp. G2M2-11 TaxID=2787627 RepID=UPI0019D04699|nr:Cys-tRNA(Pro) deacylase [Thalassotalea sp. G2M2-11]